MSVRALLLPLVALAAALALVGTYVSAGGADFVPNEAADPCRAQPLAAPTKDLDQLAQQVVLLGVQNAACALGVSRERLLLALPSERDRLALARKSGRDERGLELVLKGGLGAAVNRLDRARRLPKASDLRDAYAGDLGLPGIAEEAVRRIPDGIVDGLLPTGPVLRRALAKIDVGEVLRNLDDTGALQQQLEGKIRQAALDEAKARLTDKLPGPIKALLSLGF